MAYSIYAIGNSGNFSRKSHYPRRSGMDEGDIYEAHDVNKYLVAGDRNASFFPGAWGSHGSS